MYDPEKYQELIGNNKNPSEIEVKTAVEQAGGFCGIIKYNRKRIYRHFPNVYPGEQPLYLVESLC